MGHAFNINENTLSHSTEYTSAIPRYIFATFTSLLTFSVYSQSALLATRFEWQEPGALTSFTLSSKGLTVTAGPLCRPVQSLLQVHRFSLTRVDILAEVNGEREPPAIERVRATSLESAAPQHCE